MPKIAASTALALCAVVATSTSAATPSQPATSTAPTSAQAVSSDDYVTPPDKVLVVPPPPLPAAALTSHGQSEIAAFKNTANKARPAQNAVDARNVAVPSVAWKANMEAASAGVK